MRSTLDALLKLLPLENLPRTGWIQHGITDPETLAAHMLGVAQLGLALAPRVEPGLNVDRVVALAVVHDAGEALIGDLPRSGSSLLPPGAKQAAEAEAARIVLEPCHPTALARAREYEAGETREARFTRLCDRLQLGVRLLAYIRSGRRGLNDFVQTVQETDCQEFEVAVRFQEELIRNLADAASGS